MSNYSYLPESELWTVLEQGATLTTVNRRLSRGLQERFAEQQQAKGNQVWETPDVLPWGSWLLRCLQQASYLHPGVKELQILNADQELTLWEEIIAGSEQARGMLYLKEAARLAREGWILFQHWKLQEHDDPWLWSGPDQQAFRQWSQDFLELVQDRGWLEEARQLEHAASVLESGCLPCPEELILAGFEQISPLQEEFLELLRSKDCQVQFLEFAALQSQVRSTALADREQEMRCAARWARGHLESCAQQRIGIIVPDLYQVRAQLMHTFDDVLHPDRSSSIQSYRERVFDISLGEPLSVYPLIRTALHILKLVQDPVDLDTVSILLRSPFLQGAETEEGERGRLEILIRENKAAEVPWQELLRMAELETGSKKPCAELVSILRSLQAVYRELPAEQAPSAWGQDLDRLLRSMGWPGDRPLDSAEYQTLQAWNSCLQRLATLDQIQPVMGLGQAVFRLRAVLEQYIFQPEGSQAQVQIMGMLEAVGTRFQRLWIMGLNDQVWPPEPQPNPFLPAALQSQLDMPRSNAGHELRYARRIMQQLQGSAQQAILSYARQEEDREIMPSPLITDIPAVTPDELYLARDPDPWRERVPYPDLEKFQEKQGPQWPTSEKAPGGAGLLRSQALCPFQAFARYRLQIRAPAEPVPGLDALDRGRTMHTALEYFWQHCRDLAALLAMSGQELRKMVSQCVQSAVQKQSTRYRLDLSREFRALEEERLISLLLEWLQLEAKRQPFQVQALEQEQYITLGGLQLKVTADRIDRLPDGGLLVIDYKTGEPSINEWFRERPREPQLPLYSLFCEQPVSGIYFGIVRKGQCRFAGLGVQEGLVPGGGVFSEHKQSRDFASPDDIWAWWRSVLEALAAEILRGEARAAPSTQQACRQCDLHILCREAHTLVELF